MDKDRITRKDLKQPDEFMLFTTRAYHWAVTHQMRIFYALLVIFAGIIVSVFLQNWHMKREAKASNILFEAQGAVSELESERPAKGTKEHDEALKKAIDAFDMTIKRYPSTKSAKLAIFYKGNLLFEEGKYKEALEQYNKIRNSFKGDERTVSMILSSIGYADEGAGDLKGALASFKVATGFNLAPRKDILYYKIAQISKSLGNKEESLKYYNMIISDHPESKLIGKVNSELGEVK